MTAVDEGARWSAPAFSVGDVLYTWADVAAFAQRDGRWARLVREVGEGLACERAGHVADPATVKQAATEFRYRHRLVSGEETEAWLRARGVDVADWMGYIRRSVLRAGCQATDGVPADTDVDALLWSTGRCGGLLDDFARALAERVAVHVRVAGDVPTRLEEADAAVERFRAEVVTVDAIEAVIAARHLDWLRVAMEEAHFGTEGAAREAVLCVRDDGLDLNEVCDLAGARLVQRRCRLEECDAAMRPLVLGARLGELLGPVPIEGGFVLARVESKIVPSSEDRDIRKRAGEVALAAAVRREVEERVRWHDGP